MFGHSLLTKAKGRDTDWWRNKKGIYFGEADTGKQWISVSKTEKVLSILPGLYMENVGQRSVGTCREAGKVRPIIVLGSITQGSCWLRAVLIA